MFDSSCSTLQQDPKQLRQCLSMLAEILEPSVELTGLIEIGSFAKGEAVQTSDVDLRVYVCSPAAYIFNHEQSEPLPDCFLQKYGGLPNHTYDWAELSEPVAQAISTCLSRSVEFDLVDYRYANHQLRQLHQAPSLEHSFLFQSNILYDPQGYLGQLRDELAGIIFPPLVDHYRQQFMARVSKRLPDFLEPHPWDNDKLEKSGQIQWVQQAVRCLREAAAMKSYMTTGVYLYKKRDILRFYRQYLLPEVAFVQKLYDWKTNPVTRAEMVRRFRHHPERWYARFREMTPRLERIVRQVRELEIS